MRGESDILLLISGDGGELVEIRNGFLTVGEKYFRFVHQMYNDETGRMVATCDCVAVQASLETEKSLVLPKDVVEAAKKHLVTSPSPETFAP